jgi:hypothetical protein
MRRQERHIVNGALIGIGIGAFLDILLQWLEHQKKGTEFNWENYNGWRTIKTAAATGAVGAGMGYVAYQYKLTQEAKLPFCSDEYLQKVLREEHIKADPLYFERVIKCREQLKQWLVNRFGYALVAPPEDTGSFFKRTAISSNFDLDIVLPFKKSSYSSLEEMYYDVFNAIGEKYFSLATVTKQTKAIGITFHNDGLPIHFDIVPGREIKNYLVEKDLNLFVRPKWVWQRGSLFKTNIGAQKKLTTNMPEVRKVIKLLKAYRDRNGLPLPTIIVEQCVIAALSNKNYGVHPSTTENLLNSMSFIAEMLGKQCLIDATNSNNNLLDKIEEIHRSYVSNQLLKDIKRIEDNPRYVKEVFEL